MHEETNEDEKDKLELGEKILVTITSNTAEKIESVSSRSVQPDIFGARRGEERR